MSQYLLHNRLPYVFEGFALQQEMLGCFITLTAKQALRIISKATECRSVDLKDVYTSCHLPCGLDHRLTFLRNKCPKIQEL